MDDVFVVQEALQLLKTEWSSKFQILSDQLSGNMSDENRRDFKIITSRKICESAFLLSG